MQCGVHVVIGLIARQRREPKHRAKMSSTNNLLHTPRTWPLIFVLMIREATYATGERERRERVSAHKDE